MEYDEEKLDRAALVMLLLNYEHTGMCWKSLNWEVTDRLFEAGFISDPKNENKSVTLTELGLKKAKEILSVDFNGKI